MKPDLIVTRTGDTVTIKDEHGVRSITEEQLKAGRGFAWSDVGTAPRRPISIWWTRIKWFLLGAIVGRLIEIYP